MKKLLLSTILLFMVVIARGQYSPYGVTVAGGNGQGSAANQLYYPWGVFVDDSGNIYISDELNHRIQKWAAGSNSGITVAAGITEPTGLVLDDSGNIYICDAGEFQVMKWALGGDSGITVVGGNGEGSGPDQVVNPLGLSIDKVGNVYITDYGNSRIQKFSPKDGGVTTVAGVDVNDTSANGLFWPSDAFVDDSENIYITDGGNHRIQKWLYNATSGSTIARGINGAGIVVDDSENIYVAANNSILKFPPGASSGITVAGGVASGSSSNQLNSPEGLCFDKEGNLYVADWGNNRVQKFFNKTITITSPIDTIYLPSQNITVNYSVSSSFNTGNTFTLQLSDDKGDFLNPTNLATINNTGNGTINAVIPANLSFGCGFLLRIQASNPPVSGSPTSAFRIGNVTTPPGNYALKLDGKTGYVDLGTWFDQPNFTLSFWAAPDSSQDTGATLIQIQNDLALYSNPAIADNYILLHLMQQDLLPNQWQHITITMNGATNNRQLFLDGQLVQTNTWTYDPQSGYDLRLGNGGNYTSTYWKGLIDNVKIYNYVLSDSAILQDVNKTLTGTEPGLLAYWTFDDAVCSATSIDLTSNHRVATLNGGVTRVPSTVPNLGQQVITNVGGNSAPVNVNIYGAFFEQGAVVQLSKTGSPTIVADSVNINSQGNTIACQLPIAGADTGLYDVSVLNPDSTVKLYPGAFTIQATIPPDLWVNIIGKNVIREDQNLTFLVVYGNNGNVDANGVPLWVAIQGDSTIIPQLNFNINAPKDYTGTMNYDSISTYFIADSFNGQAGQFVVIPLYVPIVAPGSEGAFSFTIKTEQNLSIQAVIGQPFYWPPNSQNLNTCVSGIVTADMSNVLQNAVSGAVCMDSIYNAISQAKEFPVGQTGSLLWNMAAALKLCATTNLTASTLSTMSKEVYEGIENSNPANSANAVCLGVLVNKGVQIVVQIINSFDPNLKSGPAKYSRSDFPYSYSIYFSNSDTATAPAQQVVVLDTLDKTKFDLSTFSFGILGWGDSVYMPTYPLQQLFSNNYKFINADSLVVQVGGYIDTSTGVVAWQFTSLDPTTMELTTDPTRGFLPPDVTSPQGEGFVSFNVKPLPGITTGTQVNNTATVVFDFNPNMATNTYTNFIDDIAPHSQVSTPATINDTTFNVSWSGTDVGSGIQYYDIYVQQDTGAFSIWNWHTGNLSATYTGAIGNNYTFFSLATDSAGNVQTDTVYSKTSILSGINEPDVQGIALNQNTPNPFSGETFIDFYLPQSSDAVLTIKDIYGRTISTLFDGQSTAGWQRQTFNSNNLSAGIYLYQLSVNGATLTRKMVIE